MAVQTIFPAWFDHLEEGFSCKDVQFKKFCPPVETFNDTSEPLF